MKNDINRIAITVHPGFTKEEQDALIAEEIAIWDKKGKELFSIEICDEKGEAVIKSNERSPIRRVRRITGYLSNLDNFNAAKVAEEKERVSHAGPGIIECIKK